MASFQSVEDPIPECTAASGSSIFSISTMDGRLEYIDEGTHSSLPPLLFLHGYLADAESFRGVLDYMTLHGYRVIALDFPGYGYNRHLAPLSSMNGWVDYVFNFLSSLNLQSCILVGHSLGGMVAQQFAVSHPNYCSKLILSGTSCIGRIPCRFETLEESIDRFHKLGFVSTAHEIVKRGFQSNLTETYRLSHLAFGAVSRTSLEAVEASFRGMLNWGDTGRANLDADLIRVPTLILWGDKDSTIERTLANRLEESIRSSYLSVLPQTGHFSHLEIPSIIGENILCFLHDQPVPQYRFEFFSAAEIAFCLDDDRCVSKRLLETLPPRDQRQQAVYRLTW